MHQGGGDGPTYAFDDSSVLLAKARRRIGVHELHDPEEPAVVDERVVLKKNRPSPDSIAKRAKPPAARPALPSLRVDDPARTKRAVDKQ